jgi:hypothetical protein
MEALVNAIMEIYASIYSPDSDSVSHRKRVAGFNEEMGILIQESGGRRVGVYYLPVYAGVALQSQRISLVARIKRELACCVLSWTGDPAVDRLSA